jgi:hypothetical protein
MPLLVGLTRAVLDCVAGQGSGDPDGRICIRIPNTCPDGGDDLGVFLACWCHCGTSHFPHNGTDINRNFLSWGPPPGWAQWPHGLIWPWVGGMSLNPGLFSPELWEFLVCASGSLRPFCSVSGCMWWWGFLRGQLSIAFPAPRQAWAIQSQN